MAHHIAANLKQPVNIHTSFNMHHNEQHFLNSKSSNNNDSYDDNDVAERLAQTLLACGALDYDGNALYIHVENDELTTGERFALQAVHGIENSIPLRKKNLQPDMPNQQYLSWEPESENYNADKTKTEDLNEISDMHCDSRGIILSQNPDVSANPLNDDLSWKRSVQQSSSQILKSELNSSSPAFLPYSIETIRNHTLTSNTISQLGSDCRNFMHTQDYQKQATHKDSTVDIEWNDEENSENIPWNDAVSAPLSSNEDKAKVTLNTPQVKQNPYNLFYLKPSSGVPVKQDYKKTESSSKQKLLVSMPQRDVCTATQNLTRKVPLNDKNISTPKNSTLTEHPSLRNQSAANYGFQNTTDINSIKRKKPEFEIDNSIDKTHIVTCALALKISQKNHVLDTDK